MNKNKLTTLTLVTLVTLFTCLPSYPKCSSRQLNKVCSTCQTQALNSSQCMSSCPSCPTTPACPTTTCPTTTCPPDIGKINQEAINDLRTTYTLSVAFKGGGTHNYTLFITSVKYGEFAGNFSYSASYLNTGQQFNTVGTIIGTTIHFMLPAVAGGIFFPLDCLANIDERGGGGITSGLCTSIQQISFSDLRFVGGDLSGR